ncbi:S-type pyocin domain-containing protein [Enterobacteriaceae bacterium LUAb1]
MRNDNPLITWTPASTPGSQDSWKTGNNSTQAYTVTIAGLEHPDIQGATMTTIPVSEEKDLRDYIRVFPENIHPPLCLSKRPTDLPEAGLYREVKGHSQQSKQRCITRKKGHVN